MPIPVAFHGGNQAYSDPINDLRQILQLPAEHVIPGFPDHLHSTVLQRVVSVILWSQM